MMFDRMYPTALIEFHEEVAALLVTLHKHIKIPGLLAEELTHVTSQLRDFRQVAIACENPRPPNPLLQEWYDPEAVRNFCVDALLHPTGCDFFADLQRCCAISIPLAKRDIVRTYVNAAAANLQQTLRTVVYGVPMHMSEWCERELVHERRRIVVDLFCKIVEYGVPSAVRSSQNKCSRVGE